MFVGPRICRSYPMLAYVNEKLPWNMNQSIFVFELIFICFSVSVCFWCNFNYCLANDEVACTDLWTVNSRLNAECPIIDNNQIRNCHFCHWQWHDNNQSLSELITNTSISISYGCWFYCFVEIQPNWWMIFVHSSPIGYMYIICKKGTRLLNKEWKKKVQG